LSQNHEETQAVTIPHEIDTPEIMIDVDILDRNIERMASAVRARGLSLRPHAKTHKIAEIANRQIAAGASGLTVATIGEAEVFALQESATSSSLTPSGLRPRRPSGFGAWRKLPGSRSASTPWREQQRWDPAWAMPQGASAPLWKSTAATTGAAYTRNPSHRPPKQQRAPG
jgi:hypothetical protein